MNLISRVQYSLRNPAEVEPRCGWSQEMGGMPEEVSCITLRALAFMNPRTE